MADKLLLVIPDGADSLIAILDQYMKGNRESFDTCSFADNQ